MKNTEQDLQKESSKREEEVDLSYVFILFGKFLSSIFSLIGNFFQIILNAVLDVLLFIRSHFRKLVIATIIGGVLGFSYQNFIKEKEFESSMTVQPNFGSAVQLYKNVAFYKSLIEQEDFPKLMQHLQIDQ